MSRVTQVNGRSLPGWPVVVEMMGFSLMILLNKPTVQTFLAGTFFGLVMGLVIMVSKREDNSYYGYYDFKTHVSPKPFDFVGAHSKNGTHYKMLNSSLADRLYDEVKVLCWVLTGPENHEKKARHVKATWGKRCNKLIFMSSEEDRDLPAVALPVRENRAHLWAKTKEAMKYVYKHYYNEYDWFFKADDDTYVVVENLRYLLYYSNASDPLYFGCRLKGEYEDYMSGGAGYVVSKEALRRFVTESLPNKTICSQKDTGDEDVEMGKCLHGVGVQMGSSLDNEGRHRFTPLFVNAMLIPGYLDEVDWYMNMMYNSEKQGFSCCSDNLITTHYVTPYLMYLLEYLIYHVTPFGISYQPNLHQDGNKTHYDFKYYSRLKTTRGYAVTEEPTWDDFD